MSENKKLFFQVFPGFSPNKKLEELFLDVYIDKAIMKKSERTLYLHMESARIIHKENIYKMEQALKEFIFGTGNYTVKILERYILSSQYTVSKLTAIYKDSLLFELEKKSKVDFGLIQGSEWFFEGNIITLTMDDTFLSRERSIGIKAFIEHVYEERFQMPVKVGFDYTKEQISALRKANEHKLALEINQVMEGLVNETAEAEESETALTKENKEVKEKQSEKEKKEPVKTEEKQEKKSVKSDYQRGGGKNHAYDPEVFYGKNCDGDVVSINDVTEGMGVTVIMGQVMNIETREIRNEKTIVMFSITDFTNSIVGKIFVPNEDLPVILDELKKGGFYKVKGIPLFDTFSHEVTFNSITGIKAIQDFREKRMDNAYEKRVELHMHTGYSDMDSVVDVAKIIKRAKEWGHKAIAITDHGVVQAFPVANHVLNKDDDFKIIYGLEGYFVDDLKDLILFSKGQSLDDTYVVFDIETTGFKPRFNKIIEIGAVKIQNGKMIDRFSQFVNPERPIPYQIEQLTHISDAMVIDAPTIESVLPAFLEFCGDAVVVAHNAAFDTGYIRYFAKELSLRFDNTILDTLSLSHILLPELGKYTLDRLCKHLGIKLDSHHRAVDDANATAEMFLKFLNVLRGRGVENLDQINDMANESVDAIKKSRRYHGIILAQNDVGRVNLYRLVSESHIKYFNKRPLIPKSLINRYREGLILGSACEAGELYQAILDDAPDEEIARLVDFYDYLEIQPNGNNAFMIESSKFTNINSVEDLQDINKKIIKLGEEFNKPVVATCDVHFLDPEDWIYRAVIMAGKGFDDADNQPPLFFRTTEEMLAEFDYLGVEKAKEVVIDNPNKIADMIEKISPVRPDKCPPVIENSDETLTKICYDKAHEIYGPDLPEVVEERLTRELNSIISNGFAVMYIIAQKLVWDSDDGGYLVGSRGSVGSSFVATLAGITEVNPLSAHYICPECHYVDFDSDLVKQYAGRSGCDLPDQACPKCGHPLDKEGHDIPFETFLGFKGDKEPDIDLNFSSEYQSKAHAYTEELFGKGHAFRAGTIGKVADKTAAGYVYNYFKDKSWKKIYQECLQNGMAEKDAKKYADDNVKVDIRNCEKERLASGCTETKRTTGQHPGGMVVLPSNEEIYSFTPIQHPANDMSTDIITTHFEYHSIDHNLLKLDILGHADPTMIRRLEDLTGKDAKTIKLDDPNVMELFHGTEVLGITPEDIGGTLLGSLGIPEFGTDFTIQMLLDTKPKCFSDLVRISGLSHGTDVWLGNAQTLIQEGKAEISTAICCRDDIMIYLINQGLEKGLAFTIMESVRKGKGLKDEWVEEMLAHGVPDWYIWSCRKIKYMFPKAHAAAYVMMAWRIAWFKVNEPLAYYTAYFSIRAKAFDYEKMCLGKERLEFEMDKIMKNPNATAVELDSLKDMKIVQEMYARGLSFTPIDIYVADDVNFQIIDGKIMPSLSSIEGMGGKAAEQLKEAAKDGEFLSKDDIKSRAKIGQKSIDKMAELGILGDLPDSNQLSFIFV